VLVTTTHRIPTGRILDEALGTGVVDHATLDEISPHLRVPDHEVESAHQLGELHGAGHIDTWTLLTLAGLDADSIESDLDRDWTVDFDLAGGVLVVSDASPSCEPWRVARGRS
jgi:hypothetical protein